MTATPPEKLTIDRIEARPGIRALADRLAALLTVEHDERISRADAMTWAVQEAVRQSEGRAQKGGVK